MEIVIDKASVQVELSHEEARAIRLAWATDAYKSMPVEELLEAIVDAEDDFDEDDENAALAEDSEEVGHGPHHDLEAALEGLLAIHRTILSKRALEAAGIGFHEAMACAHDACIQAADRQGEGGRRHDYRTTV